MSKKPTFVEFLLLAGVLLWIIIVVLIFRGCVPPWVLWVLVS